MNGKNLVIKLVCIIGYVVGILSVPLLIGYVFIDETISRIKKKHGRGYLAGMKMVLTGIKIGIKLLNLLFQGKLTLHEYTELYDETKDEIEDIADECEDNDEYVQALNELAHRIK